MRLLDHKFGRFDRRHGVGPRRFPHYDLLWFHYGAVRLTVGTRTDLHLAAPDGILIEPGVPFSGRVLRGSARASICHFLPEPGDTVVPPKLEFGFGLCDPAIRAETQAVVRLAIELARVRPHDADRRLRLLAVLLDSFGNATVRDSPSQGDALVDAAWGWAADHLSAVRSLADVAVFAGLSVSRFRARHAACGGGSAGAHLTALRLETAARLLEASDLGVGTISRQVGFAHAETLTTAFRHAYGKPPKAYRNAHLL